MHKLMLSDSFLLAEYFRPWKLVSLVFGISLLIIGSFYLPALDWDIPISFIMAICTYIAAPLCIRLLYKKKWGYLPLVAFLTWFSVDGSYAIYWHLKNPDVLETMRSANFKASLPLFWLCGMVWFYRGSLKELLQSGR